MPINVSTALQWLFNTTEWQLIAIDATNCKNGKLMSIKLPSAAIDAHVIAMKLPLMAIHG